MTEEPHIEIIARDPTGWYLVANWTSGHFDDSIWRSTHWGARIAAHRLLKGRKKYLARTHQETRTIR